ncbi:MAG: hypothetical protein AAFR71_01095 [Pseudomonadota bacterium]
MHKLVTSLAALSVLTLAGCSTTSSDTDTSGLSLPTKTFSGKWGGQAPSTLKILSESEVRYCFRGNCTNEPYTGNINRTIRFTWGESRFTFTRTSTGYDGTFRGGDGTRSTVSMS